MAMAFDEAARRTAELIAVHAVPRPASPGAAEPPTKPNNRIAAHALADVLAIWQLRYPDVVVHQTVTNRDPVQALLSLTGQAQLTVVGGGRYGRGDVKPFGGVSSAVAQGALSPVIVARRKSVGCQAETNGMR
jgi:nucleotide-binding universal stress UspA family protein